MSLNKTLEEVKAANVAAFTFLGVIVYHFGLESFHKLKLHHLGLSHIHNNIKQSLHLAQVGDGIETVIRGPLLTREELLGLVLVGAFMFSHYLSVEYNVFHSREEPNSEPVKDPEAEQVYCRDCKEKMEDSSSKYNKRLSEKYG